MQLNIDEVKVFKHWTEARIEGYAKELGMSYLEALIYLYAFNFISISTEDQRKDCGREMYKKIARGIARLLENKY